MTDSDDSTIDAGDDREIIAGRFEVTGFIGRGGMGSVMRARDLHLDREVALKSLRRELMDDPVHLERFAHEARALARLQHPNVLTVLDRVDGPDGEVVLVLEYVAGGSLADRLRSGPLPWAECVGIGGQICAGLTAAHRAGIVHRDIKPSNILLEPDGRVRIADFGIARIAGETLTRTGASPGTPGYMAPEQFRGGPATALSDQYGAAAVLFEAACGSRPYVDDPVPDPRTLAPGLPGAAADVLMRGLARRPEDRFPTTEALGQALRESLTRGPGRRGRHVGAAVVATLGVAVIVAAVIGVLLLTRGGRASAGTDTHPGSATTERAAVTTAVRTATTTVVTTAVVTTTQPPVTTTAGPATTETNTSTPSTTDGITSDDIARRIKAGDYSDGARAELLLTRLRAAGDPLTGNAAFNAGVIKYAHKQCTPALERFREAVGATNGTPSAKQVAIRKAAVKAAEAGCTAPIRSFWP